MIFTLLYTVDGEFRDDNYEGLASAKRVYWENDRRNTQIGIFDQTNHVLYIEKRKRQGSNERMLKELLDRVYKIQVDEIESFVSEFTEECSMKKARKYR